MSTVFTNKSGESQLDPQRGIMWAFIAMMPVMWLSVLLTTLLGNVWIRKEGGHEVVNGAYLWSFVTRKKLDRERRDREQEHDLAGFGNERKEDGHSEQGLRKTDATSPME
jgi:hypothetical protein